jgi:hypothetical protein
MHWKRITYFGFLVGVALWKTKRQSLEEFLVEGRAVEGKLRPASCRLIHVLCGVIAAVLPLRKSCGWRKGSYSRDQHWYLTSRS